jgi:hypothetical protein
MPTRPASVQARRSAWVATTVPLPGSARPSASVRQFIELAVNMPEHDPQVGQAIALELGDFIGRPRGVAGWPDATSGDDATSILNGVPSRCTLPASIGPPDTNTVGMFSRIAAISIPGVILSQLEMHTSASARCAFTMYSTLSAIRSREGSE